MTPQLENGYLRIANELIEAFARHSCFGGANGQVVWAIIRKTYGYNKKEDSISLSQLSSITGLSRRMVIYSLQELEAKKILHIKREKIGIMNNVNKIKINKHYSEWESEKSSLQTINNRNRAKERSKKMRELKANEGSEKLCTTGEKVGGGSEKLRQGVVHSFAPTKDNIQKTITLEKQKPVSQVKSLLSYYQEVFKHHTGNDYIPNYAKDGNLIKCLLKVLTFDRLKELIDKFFKSEDEFIKNNGYTVGIFVSQINKLQSQKIYRKEQLL